MVDWLFDTRREGEAGFQNTDGEMALGWEAECFFLKIKK